MVTKEQEQKVLDKIEEMVQELGDDSYLGMSFRGFFPIARLNIINDWGICLAEEMETLREKLEQANIRIGELESQVILTPKEVQDVVMYLDECKLNHKQNEQDSANRIVALADDPNSYDFKEQVKRNRSEQKRIEEIEKLSNRIWNNEKQ